MSLSVIMHTLKQAVKTKNMITAPLLHTNINFNICLTSPVLTLLDLWGRDVIDSSWRTLGPTLYMRGSSQTVLYLGPCSPFSHLATTMSATPPPLATTTPTCGNTIYQL